jgi:integrase
MGLSTKNKAPGLKSYDKHSRVATFDCYLPGSRTQRRRKTVQCSSYQDAKKKLREFKEELHRHFSGAVTQSQPVSVADQMPVPMFSEYIVQWWDTSISARESNKTKKRNWPLVTHHLLPFFGNRPINTIRTIDVKDFVVYMLNKSKKDGSRYSPATINTILRIFKTVMKNAIERYESDDVTIRRIVVRMPQVKFLPEPEIANELDDNEWKRFLEVFDEPDRFIASYDDPKYRGSIPAELAMIHYQSFRASQPLFAVELATGLAQSDLLSLEWKNIVTQDGEMYLKRARGKTGRVVLIPLTPEAAAGIEECRKRPVTSSRWVFVQQNGKMSSKTTLRRHFAKVKVLAGIARRLRFHDLRHSVASRLISRGVDISIVQDVLGHASITTTRRYSRPSIKARMAIKAALTTVPVESVHDESTESDR